MIVNYLSYIDESGMENFSNDPNEQCFVLSSVNIKESDRDELNGLVQDIKERCEKRELKDLIFKNLKHHRKIFICKEMAEKTGQIKIISVIILKEYITSRSSFDEENRLYNWSLRLLLERISLLYKGNAPNYRPVLNIYLSHRDGLPLRRIKEYLHRLKSYGRNCTIDWNLINSDRINSSTLGKENVLLLADITAGSIRCAFEKNKFSHKEPLYLDVLKPVIYCDEKGSSKGYGLKIYPDLQDTNLPNYISLLFNTNTPCCLSKIRFYPQHIDSTNDFPNGDTSILASVNKMSPPMEKFYDEFGRHMVDHN